MPELPEVETIRRQLAPALTGAVVVEAAGHPSAKFSGAARGVGARITAVRRRGKYLLVGTDRDLELVIHLGMTGHLSVADDAPTTLDQSGTRPWRRAYWHLDDGRTLELHDQRRFGRVAVVPTGEYSTLGTLASLGPEPVRTPDVDSPPFTPAGLHRDLARTRRRVKTALLGQRVVAGIGNIYADEALWRARISPLARRVGPVRAERLHAAIVAVLTEAIDHGGTRLRDYRSLAGDTGRHQFHLDAYGRAGLACNRCGEALRRRVVDGRGTTWCGRCQAH